MSREIKRGSYKITVWSETIYRAVIEDANGKMIEDEELDDYFEYEGIAESTAIFVVDGLIEEKEKESAGGVDSGN